MTKHPVFLAITLALVTSAVLSGCNRASNLTAHEYIQRAKDYESQYKLRASVIELKNALNQEPNNAEGRWLLAQTYLKLGFGAEAEKELTKAKELGLKNESLLPLLGEAWILQGNYQMVLDKLPIDTQSSSKINARNAHLRGSANFGLRRLEEGCKLFNEAQRLDPTLVEAYWGVAQCAAAKKDVPNARSALQKAIEINRSIPASWVLLGDLERLSNNPDAAFSAYGQALKIYPENFSALTGRVLLLLSQGKLAEAEKDIQRMQTLAPKNTVPRYLHALVNYRSGKFEAAREGVQEALKVDTDYPPAVLMSATLNHHFGSDQQAEKEASRFLAWYPGNEQARKLLAAIQLRNRQPDRVLKTLAAILRKPDVDPQTLALASDAYFQLNQTDKATALLEKAIAQSPENVPLRTHLGQALFAAGDTDRAVAELESVMRLENHTPEASMALIIGLLNAGKHDKALSAIEDLKKKLPNNAILLNLQGVIYLAKNDLAKARVALDSALKARPDYFPAAMNLAQVDLMEKNEEAATRRYKSILSVNQTHLPALLALARLSAKGGRTDEAVKLYERATKAHPKAIAPRRELVAIYLQRGKPDKALTLATEYQQANPGPAGLEMLGEVQLASKDLVNAVGTFKRLTTLIPQAPRAHYQLATAQSLARNLTDAKASLLAALKLQPDFLEAEVLMLTVEQYLNGTGAALRVAKEIQQRHPKSAEGFALEGDLLSSQRQFSTAAGAYENALRLGPSTINALRLFNARRREGELETAYRVLTVWLKDHPTDLRARLYMAGALVRDGRIKDALPHYELAVKSAPNDYAVLNDAANAFHLTKDPRALAYAEKAYQLRPKNPQVLDTLGWILAESGNLQRALPLLKAAVAAAPGAGDIGYHYAAALAKTGKKAEARKELQHLLDSSVPFDQREQARRLLSQI